MTNIRLMADYLCHPLWYLSPDGYEAIDPGELPISMALQLRLEKWACAYDRTLDMNDPANSGFRNANAEAEFQLEGYQLVERLRNELGPGYVVSAQV
ncbi:hypothetical protein [Lacisediminimonas sp.]|uniref:hypothetical protein n=1 Tax=Lacisediminimonas sp. TaxID=3060582 RepID=UPI00271FE34A|nr:hypothetical protein [Lacisediminimonas sp.]MDO8300720.1 hypothetical protein [Lacisediminimonas sp.]MDO9216837.1 hypothetical protein [Lacisediminimonas sp.]